MWQLLSSQGQLHLEVPCTVVTSMSHGRNRCVLCVPDAYMQSAFLFKSCQVTRNGRSRFDRGKSCEQERRGQLAAEGPQAQPARS